MTSLKHVYCMHTYRHAAGFSTNWGSRCRLKPLFVGSLKIPCKPNAPIGVLQHHSLPFKHVKSGNLRACERPPPSQEPNCVCNEPSTNAAFMQNHAKQFSQLRLFSSSPVSCAATSVREIDHSLELGPLKSSYRRMSYQRIHTYAK